MSRAPQPQFHLPHKSARHPTTGQRLQPAKRSSKRAGVMLAVAAPLVAAAGVGLWFAANSSTPPTQPVVETPAPLIDNNVPNNATSTEDLIRDAAGIPDDPATRALIAPR